MKYIIYRDKSTKFSNLDFDTQASSNGYQTAAPPAQFNNTGDEGGGGGGLCDTILSAFCAAFCKDNPLAEQLGFNQPAAHQPPEQNELITTPPAVALQISKQMQYVYSPFYVYCLTKFCKKKNKHTFGMESKFSF